ncbi:MAG: hypothetical protein Q7J42_03560 [Sulfuritalea sp.]|nr:hypothetical protein [Sulfuritalea sp.]
MPVTRRKVAAIEQHGQTHIERGQRRRLSKVQPRLIDVQEHRLAAEADEGCGKSIVAGMAEDYKARAAEQFLAPRDERLAPAMRAQGRPQFGARSRHHHAAFVELGQRVAQGTTRRAASLARIAQSRYVTPVEGRLAAREGEPDQRIEQIMPVAGPRRDLAGQEGSFLVSIRSTGRLDKAQRRAAARYQPAVKGCSIQPGYFRCAVGKPGPQKSRQRMKFVAGWGHARRQATDSPARSGTSLSPTR